MLINVKYFCLKFAVVSITPSAICIFETDLLYDAICNYVTVVLVVRVT